jgi:hypothetical protein
MWHAYVVFDSIVLPLWVPMWSTPFSFYMSPHCDYSIHNLCNTCQSSLYYYFFGGATYLVLCGTKNELLVSTVIIPFSHNIVASLCYCNVDCFIPVVRILKYESKFALNIVIKMLYVVGTYKP